MSKEQKLMTEEEYDAKLRDWARRVSLSSRAVLEAGTHGTGKLANGLREYVDRMKNGTGRHIAFRFEPYGIFRQYGAGRGWVIVNGVPTPGYRVVSLKDRSARSRWGAEAYEMAKRGFSNAQIKSAKKVNLGLDPKKKREPLDWLDVNIARGKEELADIAGLYWGDMVLEVLANQISKAKIVKKK